MVRMHDREPTEMARARADAAHVLYIALGELELQALVLASGHTPRKTAAAAAKVS